MENKAFQVFVLKALRKLAWATLTGKYEVSEIKDIHHKAGKELEGLGEDKDD